MAKWILLVAMLITVKSEAADPLTGKYVAQKSIQTGIAKSRPSAAVIRIGTVVASRAPVFVDIAEPTARQECSGSISGRARVVGDRLTLSKKNVAGETCKLVIAVDGDRASVVSESGCGGFHGVGCSFDTSAVNLFRVRE